MIRLALASVLLLASCVMPGPVDARVQRLGMTSNWLDVSVPRLDTVNDVPVFSVDVTNVSIEGGSFEWCVEFFTDGGKPTALSDTRWKSVSIAAGERKRLSLVASNPSASEFLFKTK
ncbi:MAG: hypothetical protein FJX65_19015 [Alphaproteobacteria bacterium]|nr:hypothetical protein [Alphaproteobacteria bacterium]